MGALGWIVLPFQDIFSGQINYANVNIMSNRNILVILTHLHIITRRILTVILAENYNHIHFHLLKHLSCGSSVNVVTPATICHQQFQTDWWLRTAFHVHYVSVLICRAIFTGLTLIEAWVINHITGILWSIIIHPCPYFKGGLVKSPLKLGHGWVITPHSFMWA